jgi:hypothetical protein
MLLSPFSLRTLAPPPSPLPPSSAALSAAPLTPSPSRRLLPLRAWWRVLARRHRRQLSERERERAALEACASEGAALDLRTVEFDGRPYNALYRHGELVCLLPGPTDMHD